MGELSPSFFLVLLLGTAFCDKTARFQCSLHWLHRLMCILLVDRCIRYCSHRAPRKVLHAFWQVPIANSICQPRNTTCCEDRTRASQGALFPSRVRQSVHIKRAEGFLFQVARKLSHPAVPRHPV